MSNLKLTIAGNFRSKIEFSNNTNSTTIELDFESLIEQLEKQGILVKRPYVLEVDTPSI